MTAPLIVLSGEAGAGKDSVAKILVEKHGWELFSLSAPMKRFAEDMFGFSKEQLYGPSSARNAPDPRWARPCPNCGATGLVTHRNTGDPTPCPDCQSGKINDNSARRILQLMGEEFLRQMIHIDALTMRARPELEALLNRPTCKGIVVNDARHDNDRNNLHNWLGAHRVDVRAPNKKADGAEWRKHVSELSRPVDADLEFIINNDEQWPFHGLSDLVTAMLSAFGIS